MKKKLILELRNYLNKRVKGNTQNSNIVKNYESEIISLLQKNTISIVDLYNIIEDNYSLLINSKDKKLLKKLVIKNITGV